jgi:hypothetical protein
LQNDIIRIYSVEENKVKVKDDTEFDKVIQVLNQSRFFSTLDHFTENDKLDLLRCFEVIKYRPG